MWSTGGRPDAGEGRFAGADRRREAGEPARVGVDAGGAQLGERGDGLLGLRCRLPDGGGQPEGSGLGGVELDRRQLEVLAPHAVADLVGEQRVVAAGLHRHPHHPQLVLVPLEGALEGCVGEVVVALDDLADLALLDEPSGHEKADRQVHDPFGFAGRHVVDVTGSAWMKRGGSRWAQGGIMSGRFAPSPTAALHLGNLRTAVLALAVRPQHRTGVPAPHRGPRHQARRCRR